MRMYKLLYLLFLFTSLVICVKFTLPVYPPGYYASKKCLTLPIQPDTLVTGYFNSTKPLNAPPFRTNVWIEDGSGNRHLQKLDIKDETRFSFRTYNRSMDHFFCITNESPEGSYYKSTPVTEVEIVAELDYDLFDDSLAHTLKVRPLEAEIMNMDTAMRHLIRQLEELHLEERNLREINEISNTRIRYLSILALITLVTLGCFQMFYMKRYLKRKKLI